MKKIFTKEVSIALITIATGLIFYAGLNYMKGTNVFKHANYYYVRMNNVNELQKSSPVYADGYKIGLVHDMGFDYVNHGDIVVQVNLDKKMKVQKNSYFTLRSGLTSGAYLDLIINKSATEFASPGDTLQGETPVGMMDRFSKNVLPQIEDIMPRLDSILLGIQLLVNHEALTASLENIAATTQALNTASRQINALVKEDIRPIVGKLNEVSENFIAVSENLRQTDFNTTLKSVTKAVENIEQMAERLNSTDNSLGLLLNDRSLYLHIDSAAVSATQLLDDIKQNPKKYVKLSLF